MWAGQRTRSGSAPRSTSPWDWAARSRGSYPLRPAPAPETTATTLCLGLFVLAAVNQCAPRAAMAIAALLNPRFTRIKIAFSQVELAISNGPRDLRCDAMRHCAGRYLSQSDIHDGASGDTGGDIEATMRSQPESCRQSLIRRIPRFRRNRLNNWRRKWRVRVRNSWCQSIRRQSHQSRSRQRMHLLTTRRLLFLQVSSEHQPPTWTTRPCRR